MKIVKGILIFVSGVFVGEIIGGATIGHMEHENPGFWSECVKEVDAIVDNWFN